MPQPMSRRTFLAAVPSLCAATALTLHHPAGAQTGAVSPSDRPVPSAFPAQDPARVKEMVGVSHGNLARVEELLSESPALAKATWDWGFGDWETALGAASHTGNQPIAAALMAHGARPDLFTFAMLGHLDVVRAYVTAQPGIQRLAGPHGLTLLHHARKGGPEARAVVAYLESVGDADLKTESRPLADAVRQGCVGEYTCAAGTLAVTEKNSMLWIKRLPDGTGRSLFHLGDRVFHPVGAPAVRVRFTGDESRAEALQFTDGPLTFSARFAGDAEASRH